MEHTHLVKGLDFALLQKVSADIAAALALSSSTDTQDGCHYLILAAWISLPGKGCCRAGDLAWLGL